MRKGLLGFVLMLCLLVASPVFAADLVNVNVNGDLVMSESMYQENGVSMISAESFCRFAGATMEKQGDGSIKITENETTFVFTPGVKDALVNGEEPVLLPVEPVEDGDEVLIPLRATAVVFGFEVNWDAEKQTAMLAREETRDGLTPEALLVKCNEVTRDINTYSLEGNMDMNMVVEGDGKVIEDVPQNITTKMSGTIQNEPMQLYMKQIVELPAEAGLQDITVETYMTEEKMYIKSPGQGWMVMDTPFTPEFWQTQRDIQQDPLKATAIMEEMGLLLNYGNDVTTDGNDYYVINAALDMKKFRQFYEKMMSQMMQGMNLNGSLEDQEKAQQAMQKLMDSASMDYYYSVYVNKKTLFSDIMWYNANLSFNMDASDMGAAPESELDAPKSISMKISVKGQFEIFEPGKPFVAPDVSQAVEMNMGGEAPAAVN